MKIEDIFKKGGKERMKQIRLIGFTCKAKDLTTRLNEEWERLENIKKEKEKKTA